MGNRGKMAEANIVVSLPTLLFVAIGLQVAAALWTSGPRPLPPSLGRGAGDEPRTSQACMRMYADELEKVSFGVGDEIYEAWAADQAKPAEGVDPRPIVLDVGFGHTGTRFVAEVLEELNYTSMHWGKMYSQDRSDEGPQRETLNRKYHKRIIHNLGWNERGWTGEMRQNCYADLRGFTWRYPTAVDSILDDPAGQLFWDLYLTYPNARFIMSERPSAEWVKKRLEFTARHWDLAPLLFSCGRTMGDFTEVQLVALYDAYKRFVHCVVPDVMVISLFTEDVAKPRLQHRIAKYLERQLANNRGPMLQRNTERSSQ